MADDRLRTHALDEFTILVVVDNETDTLSSVDDGLPQIPEVVHLAARLPASRRHEGHDCKSVFDQLCCACHGLSVLLTGRHAGAERTMLFDVGPYPDIWLDNARRLGIRAHALGVITETGPCGARGKADEKPVLKFPGLSRAFPGFHGLFARFDTGFPGLLRAPTPAFPGFAESAPRGHSSTLARAETQRLAKSSPIRSAIQRMSVIEQK